jgi:hypothetical protein
MFYTPIGSLDSWQLLLADPVLHWKEGYSAKCLATAWFGAGGPPQTVREVLAKGPDTWKDIEYLLCFPEHKVDLPGGSRASQSDIFVLAKARESLISIVVEGKCLEPFGPTVAEWSKESSSGKDIRIDYILDLLQLRGSRVEPIRYQLLHRTASAIIEARRFLCTTAIVLIHIFADSPQSYSDYSAFLNLYGLEATRNGPSGAVRLGSIDLYFAWIQDRVDA